MLFAQENAELIEEQWRQVAEAQGRSANIWQEAWQISYDELVSVYEQAVAANTPEAWSAVIDRAHQLREAMDTVDGGDENLLYLALGKLSDRVYAALKQAGRDSTNLMPPERNELVERITRLERQVEEEQRRAALENGLRERLAEALEDLGRSKRTIQINVVNVDPASIIGLIRDALEALKHGIDLLNDERFTGPLRKRALIAWYSAKNFVQAAKRRFVALKFPWQRSAITDEFEGDEPDFHLEPSSGIAFIVRNGNTDMTEHRVPGGGVSFRDRWLVNGRKFASPEMLVVPAGEFLMGSSESGQVRSLDESPQHPVTIHTPFAIGRYPVTFAEWDAFVTSGGSTYKPKDQGWGRRNRPVINVSWNDAQKYIAWLREVTGKDYRLPSEAEREYAARAGTSTHYSFGDSERQLDNYGWYSSNSGGKTHPVGKKQPNGWGLYDFHGNVWEWCEDRWHENYRGAPDDGSAWIAGDNIARVLRGGSWFYDPQFLRSASRIGDIPVGRNYFIGFRLARTLNL